MVQYLFCVHVVVLQWSLIVHRDPQDLGCNLGRRQFQPHANLMTARRPNLALFPHSDPREGKREGFQQLSLCFGCEKSSQKVTLKTALARDILGYTQLHREPVTPRHFLSRLGDASPGEVSQLPDL